MMEDANEIQEAMSRSYGTPDIDEADLEAGQSNTLGSESCCCLHACLLLVDLRGDPCGPKLVFPS